MSGEILGKKIKELARNQNISIRQICLKIGITEAGLSYSFKNDTLSIRTLKKIANLLGVELSYFFINAYKKSNEPLKKVSMVIQFNELNIPNIIIENPLFIPVDGAIFEFSWSDYIKNKKYLKTLEEFEECSCLVSRIFKIYYSKSGLVVYVDLYSTEEYERMYKRI